MPSWHSFKESSWPEMGKNIASCWTKLCNDNPKEIMKVFFKNSHGQYVPEAYLHSGELEIPGKYPEMAIFMRHYEDWAR